jgi:hypothetical protein
MKFKFHFWSILFASVQTLRLFDNLPILSYFFALKRKIIVNKFLFISLIFIIYCLLINNSIISFLRITIFIITLLIALNMKQNFKNDHNSWYFLIFVVCLFIIEAILNIFGFKSPLVRMGGAGLLIFSEPSYAALTIFTVLITCTNFLKMFWSNKIIILFVYMVIFYCLDTELGIMLILLQFCFVCLPEWVLKIANKLMIFALLFVMFLSQFYVSTIISNYTTESFRLYTALLAVYSIFENPLGSGTVYIHDVFNTLNIFDGLWADDYISKWASLSPQAPMFNFLLFGGIPGLIYNLIVYFIVVKKLNKNYAIREQISLKSLFYFLFFIQSTLASFLIFFILARGNRNDNFYPPT